MSLILFSVHFSTKKKRILYFSSHLTELLDDLISNQAVNVLSRAVLSLPFLFSLLFFQGAPGH